MQTVTFIVQNNLNLEGGALGLELLKAEIAMNKGRLRWYLQVDEDLEKWLSVENKTSKLEMDEASDKEWAAHQEEVMKSEAPKKKSSWAIHKEKLAAAALAGPTKVPKKRGYIKRSKHWSKKKS